MKNKEGEMKMHLIPATATLREGFCQLNMLSGGTMTLFVTDVAGRLVGSLTDGDMRRAVIAGIGLDDAVEKACHKDCLNLREGTDRYRGVSEARKRGVQLLPITDSEGKITELLDLCNLKAALPIDAVLMAGGKGERLRPLTEKTPKPLLNVGDKAIIDYNVDELLSCGVEKVYVTVNYLKEQIEGHFQAPRFEGRVECVAEPKRLGTMGSLALVKGLSHDHVLVMNSDLLTTLDFEKMYLAHVSSGAELTMAAVPYTVSVPFAIINHQGRRITGLSEKPTFNYFANAGVYMMRRRVVESIVENEYLDAPDLMERLIAEGEKVEFFPIDGTWIDIGSPDDYRYANELMKKRGS